MAMTRKEQEDLLKTMKDQNEELDKQVKLTKFQIKLQEDRIKILKNASDIVDAEMIIEEKKLELQKLQYKDYQDNLQLKLNIAAKADKQTIKEMTDLIEATVKLGGLTEEQGKKQIENINITKDNVQRVLKENEALKQQIESEEQRLDVMRRAFVAANSMDDATKNAITSLTGISNLWKNTFLGRLAESTKVSGGFTVALQNIGKGIKETITPANILGSTLMKIKETTKVLALAQDMSLASFNATTAAAGKYDDTIIKTERSSFYLGISTEDAANSVKALREGFTNLDKTSKSSIDDMTKFSSVVAKLGVDEQDTANFFQMGTKVMGNSVAQSKEEFQKLLGTASALDISYGKMTKDFKDFGGRLAVYGKNMVSVLKDMENQSKKTGLSMGQLTEMASEFDTFEQAANKVGELNAMLGSNSLDVMQMLEANDPQRTEMIRASILNMGLSFETMSVAQQRAFTRMIPGLKSTDDLAKLLSKDVNNLTDEEKSRAVTEKQLAEQAEKAMDVTKKFTAIMNSFAISMRPVIEALGSAMTWIQNLNDSLGGYLIPTIAIITGAIVGLSALFWGFMVPISAVGTALGVMGASGAAAAGGIGAAGAAAAAASPGIGAAGAAGAAAAPGLSAFALTALAVGGAILMIGAGIGIATWGISKLVDSLKDTDSAKLGELFGVISIGILSIASAAGLATITVLTFGASSFIAAIGVGALAVAVGLLGAALWLSVFPVLLISSSISKVADSLSKLAGNATGLFSVGEGIKNIAAGISSVPIIQTVKFVNSMSDFSEAMQELKGTESSSKNVKDLIVTTNTITDVNVTNTKNLMDQIVRFKDVSENAKREPLEQIVKVINASNGTKNVANNAQSSNNVNNGNRTIILELEGKQLKKFVLDTINTSMAPKRV